MMSLVALDMPDERSVYQMRPTSLAEVQRIHTALAGTASIGLRLACNRVSFSG